MVFDEKSLENLFMSKFEALGYEHVNGETIERDTRELILKDDLERYLRSKYADENLTNLEISMIMSSFQTLDRGDYVNNRNTFRSICDGFVFRRADKTKNPIWVELIDFNNVDKNIFKIVNQFEIQGPKERRIPDAIVFINGIPLVVLEFKSTVREDATLYDAFLQIEERYVRSIPDLFAYNAFTVISDGINSKIGTHFSKYEHYYSWNKVNSSDRSREGIDSMDSMLEGAFTKERLLSIIDNFIYFPDESNSNLKVICRYPQYFGATLLFNNIKKHLKPNGDGKGGTYFGTTGCGKSYIMLFLSRLLMRSKDLSNPTIIIITDRNNLDHQLSSQFIRSKRFLKDEKVLSIESRDDLKTRLAGAASGGVYLTTIQKFEEWDTCLSERNNIIVISDEAHRSQLNMENVERLVNGEKKKMIGFGRILHDSLPNATYVGFTGTPVDETLEVFGNIVDQYTMVESERDNITSKLVYEGRAAKVILNEEQVAAIDAYYENCEMQGANQYQIDKSKKDITKMENIIGNKDRLNKIAIDFIQHYEKRIYDGASVAGKAMFVCSSRKIAFEFHQLLKKYRPDWFVVKEGANEGVQDNEKAEPIEMVKIVATRGKDDPKEMYEILGDDNHKRNLEVQFKKLHSNFKIAIVVDMWLTGFDVPFLDAIYIDKPIQKHSLIQAISRVNRIYEGKEYGLVVDYLGIRKELDAALKKYTNGFKADGLEISSDFAIIMREYLNILDGIFHGFDTSDYYSDDGERQIKCLSRAMEFVQMDEDTEKRFMVAVRKLKTAYNNCTYDDSVTKEERDKVYFYTGVRSLLAKIVKGDAPDTALMNIKVREMLERAIASDDVIQLMIASEELDENTIDLLSENYLDRIKKIPGLNTKFKLLQRLAKVTISSFKRTNKIKGDQFTEKFNAIVRKYNDRHFRADDLAEIIDVMTALIAEVYKENTEAEGLGISIEEKAFYDILEHIIDEYQFEFDKGLLTEMSKRLKECTDKTCSVLDWYDREDIKAGLQMDIALILEEFGFPPVYYTGVYQQIFSQMENYKKNTA